MFIGTFTERIREFRRPFMKQIIDINEIRWVMDGLERLAGIATQYIKQRRKAEFRRILREIFAGKFRFKKERPQLRNLTPILARGEDKTY